MTTNIAALFAVPALAIAAFGAGSSPIGAGAGESASLAASDLEIHASLLFARADLDRSHTLDADEYAALSLVTAELARLNGRVPLLRMNDTRNIPVPSHTPASFKWSERTSIEAMARREFYAAAGDDAAMSASEFVADENARFAEADRNGDGRLARNELLAFGAALASVSGAGA
jgi:hypothetical protein